AILGGDSPWASIPPSESRNSTGVPLLTETYKRPSVPPPGAEIQAAASSPVGDTANIGAVPTSVGALSGSASLSASFAESDVQPPNSRQVAATIGSAGENFAIISSYRSTESRIPR